VIRVKVAVAVLAASIVTAQVGADPLQAPAQAVKVEVASGLAASEMEVPLTTDAEQVAPQSMASGVDPTVPAPVPSLPMASG
jgi:hypothetical protein